jgi:HPt (histidine-containing phosphotransfer) domain-containing protein
MNIDTSIYSSLRKILIDSNQFTPIASSFQTNNSVRMHQLSRSIANNDFADARDIVHAIKGSCCMFGASTCTEICARIEGTLNQANPFSEPKDIEDLRVELAEFITFLENEAQQSRQMNFH